MMSYIRKSYLMTSFNKFAKIALKDIFSFPLFQNLKKNDTIDIFL